MSEVYYARPVTITDDKMREALEKQAKQRALREALDSQIHTRMGDGGPRGGNLTKAQQKRQELMQMQVDRQQQQQPPAPYQSNSLPPNFAMSSSIGFGASANFNSNGGVYDSRSLPNGGALAFGSSPVAQLPPPMGAQSREAYQGGYPAMQGLQSPNNGARIFQNQNFNIAEVYAQQQQQQFHAPVRELPVPLSPRQSNANGMYAPHEPQQQQQSSIRGGGVQQGGGMYHLNGQMQGGKLTSSIHDDGGLYGGGGGDNIREILKLANRVTDSPQIPPPPPQQAQPRDRDTSNNVSREVGGGVPPRGSSKEAKNRTAGTPMAKQTKVQESRVEKLQKELQDRQNEMQRMRDKERDWEEQVKQLKSELKNARQKERDLAKAMNEKPQRAETAPNQGSLTKLAPLQQKEEPKRLGAKGQVAGGNTPNNGGSGAPARKDFNNARVFSNDTFRPITAPLEPIDEVLRHSTTTQLPPLPDSLKMASFNTRKTAFGLQQLSSTAPLSYDQLCDFAKSQVITQFQADDLWRLFTGDEPPKRPSPPPGSRPRNLESNVRRSSLNQGVMPPSPTYETYAELADEEEEYGDGD